MELEEGAQEEPYKEVPLNVQDFKGMPSRMKTTNEGVKMKMELVSCKVL